MEHKSLADQLFDAFPDAKERQHKQAARERAPQPEMPNRLAERPAPPAAPPKKVPALAGVFCEIPTSAPQRPFRERSARQSASQPSPSVRSPSDTARDLAQKALTAGVRASFQPPSLDQNDIKLVDRWFSDSSARGQINEGSQRPTGGDRFTQLLSARAAEKTAAAFYKRLGIDAEDVSIQQALNPLSSAWKYCDLRAGETLIDVKNARHPHFGGLSTTARMRYSEHCVTRFKQYDSSHEVVIAGVLSHRVCPSVAARVKNDFDYDTNSLFLGQLSAEKYRALVLRYEGDLLRGIGGGRAGAMDRHFIPAWMFDYPTRCYANRDAVRARCGSLLQHSSLHVLGPTAIPLSLALRVPIDLSVVGVQRGSWEYALYERMLKGRAAGSLPTVFLEVLHHFLSVVAGKIPTEGSYSPAGYHRLLFTDNPAAPLGIHDPLRTVASLIKILERLWVQRSRLSQYRVFQLHAAGVLRAKVDSASDWETIAAYCGNCAADPLLIGMCELCDEHSRLVCHECGRCSSGCGAQS